MGSSPWTLTLGLFEDGSATSRASNRVDVLAKLGGWKAIRTLDLYQQPSDHMMLEALAKRRELREKAGT